MTANSGDLIEQLRSLLGDEGVLSGGAVSERTVGIWDDRTLQAKAIARPADTDELAGVMRLCHAAGQTVVTHGGLTGLVQGAVASADDLVVSLERMNRIEEVDVNGRCLVAQAGVPLQKAQEAAQEHDLSLQLDLGARGSCTLGGNVSTNAGGNRVIRFGMTRDLVLGLEAVLADGTVISSMNRMLKNNAGYDLKQLFIGTEGTLGIVTRVILRLHPAWRSENTALVACESFDQVAALLDRLDRDLGGHLSAFECMWQDFYRCTTAGTTPPLASDYPFYVLVEALGSEPDSDQARFLEVLGAAQEGGVICDAVVAKSVAEREALWAIRDSVEHCLEFGPGFIFDVSLPLAAMNAYVDQVLQHLGSIWPDHRSFAFGHVGDGNLHFVISPDTGAAADELRARVEACVYEPLQACGGSVSAEHGIGLEKKDWLQVSRSAGEIALMNRLKRALDPQGLLNPGKVIPAVENE